MKNKNSKKQRNPMVIYQAKSGAIELRGDFTHETIWANRMQMAKMFDVNPQAISKHIQNIYKEKELQRGATSSKMELVQNESGRQVRRKIDIYNLDILIAVGYRINSIVGTKFRQWATKTLREYIVDGYVVNKKRIGENYEKFMQAVADVKALLPVGNIVETKDILELINAFASTWFSLEAYDKETLPKFGATKKQVVFTAEDLTQALRELKKDLIAKKHTTEIFGQEREKKAVEGIVGNVLQSFDKKDVYPTVEEKATHLLYFMVKNHPFVDGNKRSGAFSFVWFLRRAGILRASLTPEALTALTLLIAESNPKDKDKMVGLVLLILKK